jgi:hypothetical protein
MGIEFVNVGASANDGTGDPLRDAFIKLNSNDVTIIEVAYAGTATANLALAVASTGTVRAEAAYTLAAIGTNTGTAAYNLASSAQTRADAAYTLAAIGTNTGTAAYNLAAGVAATAQAAYSIAAIGTNTGTAAYNLATTGSNLAFAAYTIAQLGTVSHQTLSFASTIQFNMTGSAYQSCTVTGNTAITVINQAAPTNSSIQVISGRLVSDGVSDHLLTWDAFGTFSTPPGTLTKDKAVLASFTSYGSTIRSVYLVSATLM